MSGGDEALGFVVAPIGHPVTERTNNGIFMPGRPALFVPTGVPSPCHSPAFLLLFPFKAMPVPPTGRSTLQPEGSSLWSSVMEPPSQNYRKQELYRGTTLRSEDQIKRGEIKTERRKPLSKVT